MGRRRVDVAPSTSGTPAELPAVRRSSRLAVKDRVEYNESRMCKQAMDNYSGKRKVSPRSTKKEKTKLKKGGAMAVRIVQESFTTSAPPPPPSRKRLPTTKSRTALATTSPTTVSSTTVSSTTMTSSMDETPVSTRLRKRALRGSAAAAAALATLPEADSPSPSASDSSIQKTTVASTGRLRARPHAAPGSTTPETLPVASSTSFRKRPSKPQQRKAKSASPDELPEVPRGRAVEPRPVRLFDADCDDDVAAADDAMPSMEEEAVVPQKRRKKDTVATKKKDTVATKKEKMDTVAKKGESAKETAASKKTRAAPTTPKANKTAAAKRQARSASVIMQRVLYNDTQEDDPFAGEYSRDSGGLDRSIMIAEQLEAGTLTLADMSPNDPDLILAELFSPIKTPSVDASLRSARPLILSSSPSSGKRRGNRGGEGRGRGRAAAAKASASLSNMLNSESDEEEEEPPSEEVWALEPSDAAYARGVARLKRSPFVRSLFAAAAKSSGSKSIEMKKEPRKAPQQPQRKKIQYPGIAPIPEDDEKAAAEEDTFNVQFRALNTVDID